MSARLARAAKRCVGHTKEQRTNALEVWTPAVPHNRRGVYAFSADCLSRECHHRLLGAVAQTTVTGVCILGPVDLPSWVGRGRVHVLKYSNIV